MPLIQQESRWAIGQASVAEIDELNILNATFLAMTRALEGLSPRPDYALIDGNKSPQTFLLPHSRLSKAIVYLSPLRPLSGKSYAIIRCKRSQKISPFMGGTQRGIRR